MKTEKKYFTVGTIPISNIKIAKRGKLIPTENVTYLQN